MLIQPRDQARSLFCVRSQTVIDEEVTFAVAISDYSPTYVITFRVSCRRREMYCGHPRLCVCLCVCVSVCMSVRCRTPTLLHGPGCNLGVVEAAPSCALLGGFAIGARVALLWQHNAKRSYKLAFVSDIAVFVLNGDVKLQPNNQLTSLPPPRDMTT